MEIGDPPSALDHVRAECMGTGENSPAALKASLIRCKSDCGFIVVVATIPNNVCLYYQTHILFLRILYKKHNLNTIQKGNNRDEYKYDG